MLKDAFCPTAFAQTRTSQGNISDTSLHRKEHLQGRAVLRRGFDMPHLPEEYLVITQDKQTELLVLKSVILCLREFSDIQQLRRGWFETGEVWLSFDELVPWISEVDQKSPSL